MVSKYLRSAVNKVFKILPLKEESNEGLSEYIDSLIIQLVGAMETYPELKVSQEYLSVVNSIYYFQKNVFSTKQCRREVFKSTATLSDLAETLETR